MHAPTRAIPTHPQALGRASIRTERARPSRGFTWRHHLFQWLRSLPVRRRGGPPRRCNGSGDPQREMIQRPPTGGAMDVYAAWGEAPRPILLYTHLP